MGKVIVFEDGPLKHNHFTLNSVPSEVRVQWRATRICIYKCTHHETKNGNVIYTHISNKYGHQDNLIQKY